MIKNISFLILLTLGLSSCDCTYSYGVYVENATGEDLEVAFKTATSDVEEKITLSNGEKKFIIENLEYHPKGDCTGTTSAHCKFVADYVHGFIRDTVQSKIEWCDEKIIFEKMDIQEAEFLIKYTADDF